ncbi:hypothetical protein K4G90_24755, partial [Mycobacterium tuberculosis]|nr:hypothetical protein [Mycobacterium tuberculosis]
LGRAFAALIATTTAATAATAAPAALPLAIVGGGLQRAFVLVLNLVLLHLDLRFGRGFEYQIG